MINSRSDNKTILIEIIMKLFNVNIKLLNENENLLSGKIGLDAVDMVYLYYEINRKFNIKIPDKYINSGCLLTIDGILNVLTDLT